MGHCLRLTALLTVSVIMLSSASADNSGSDKAESQPQPAELKVLNRYVGTWQHEVTLLPSKSTPEKTTQRVTEQTEWTLNDSFIMGREVNATNGTKALWFFTVNREDKKTYPFWYFDSQGIIGLWNGTWDARSKTMTFSPTDMPPGWKGVATHKFSTDSYVDALTITNDDGEKVLDSRRVKKRQAGIAGQNMLETWNKKGTPTTPLSKELKKLDSLVGTWDSEFLFDVPQRPQAKGVISNEWSLDGRFLFRRETVGNTKSIAMIGWDCNKQAYRIARAVSNGTINESIGQWNDPTRSFVWNWKLAENSEGVKSIATWRIVGNDAIQIHVVHATEADVRLDLTIKMKRRK